MKQKTFRYMCRDMGYVVSRPPPHMWFWVRPICTQREFWYSHSYWRVPVDKVRDLTPDSLEQALFIWTFIGLKPTSSF